MSVPILGGQSFTHGTPVQLFAAGQYYVEVARDYDVSVDGTRFLFVKSLTPRESAVPRSRLALARRSASEDGDQVASADSWPLVA